MQLNVFSIMILLICENSFWGYAGGERVEALNVKSYGLMKTFFVGAIKIMRSFVGIW